MSDKFTYTDYQDSCVITGNSKKGVSMDIEHVKGLSTWQCNITGKVKYKATMYGVTGRGTRLNLGTFPYTAEGRKEAIEAINNYKQKQTDDITNNSSAPQETQTGSI